jgi:hypothetical protein
MLPGEQGEPEDLALSEIFKRYKDSWVAIIVTSRDKNFQPTKGKVVANDIDRYRLRQKLLKYPDICILYAGEPAYPLFL